MKTKLMKSALVAASLLGAVSARAENLRATIPFEFMANSKIMPAGTYTIRPVSKSIVLYENEATKEQAMAFGSPPLTIRSVKKIYAQSVKPAASPEKGALIASSK